MTEQQVGAAAPARRVSKDERLFTLVQCLLASEQYLTARRIRETVAGYGGDGDDRDEPDDAVKRKFERDKNVLRDLGIPIETVRDAATGEEGYRIDRAAYELAPIELTGDEAVVVMVAAQVWRQGKLAGPAAGALMKLRASGVPVADSGLDTLIDTAEPAFEAVWRACRDARPIAFTYQKRDGDRPRRRTLEPWGMVCRNGLWYVAGHDRDRDAVRVFRLSRVVGTIDDAGEAGTVSVPPDVDLRATVMDWDAGERQGPRTAVLAIREGRANGLRRYARSVAPDPGRPGWDRVELALWGTEWTAGTVASFGADVIVADPPDLRDAVIRRLKGVLA